MAQFGSTSQFGVGSHYGRKESSGHVYHRLLRSLEPPGVYDETEGTLRDERLETYAKGLGEAGEDLIQRLMYEMFPRLCDSNLAEWATVFKEGLPDDAPLSERQGILYSRWIAHNRCTFRDVRMLLDEFLLPTIGFWDRHEDGDVSVRFTQDLPGSSSITEASSEVTLGSAVSAAWYWNTTADDCPKILLKLIDRSDDYWAWANVAALNAANSQGGGVALMRGDNIGNEDAAVAAEVQRSGGGTLQAVGWHLRSGVHTISSPDTSITLPNWLGIHREGNSITLVWATDPDDDTTFTTIETYTLDWTPRYVAWFWRVQTGAGSVAGDIDIDDTQVRYTTGYNNVEVIQPIAPGTGAPEGSQRQIFGVFVHRDPDDPGRGNTRLAAAQRQCDRISPGHVLLRVGRSDCFLCDDSNSLTDRDILGR